MSAVPPLPQQVHDHVPNYLVWSIINTIAAFVFCCMACLSFPAIITGIVAIVFSSQVNSKLAQGDIAGAQGASKNAQIWNWVTTVITVLAVAVVVAYLMAVGLDGYLQQLEEIRQRVEQNSN